MGYDLYVLDAIPAEIDRDYDFSEALLVKVGVEATPCVEISAERFEKWVATLTDAQKEQFKQQIDRMRELFSLHGEYVRITEW